MVFPHGLQKKIEKSPSKSFSGPLEISKVMSTSSRILPPFPWLVVVVVVVMGSLEAKENEVT